MCQLLWRHCALASMPSWTVSKRGPRCGPLSCRGSVAQLARLVPMLVACCVRVLMLLQMHGAQVQLTVPFSRTAFSSKASFEVRSPKLLNVRIASVVFAVLCKSRFQFTVERRTRLWTSILTLVVQQANAHTTCSSVRGLQALNPLSGVYGPSSSTAQCRGRG